MVGPVVAETDQGSGFVSLVSAKQGYWLGELAVVHFAEGRGAVVERGLQIGDQFVFALGGLAFFFYVSAFMTKETLFSFLMSLAFLASSTGYVLNIPKYSNSSLTFLDNVGDITRIFGLVILLIAIFV